MIPPFAAMNGLIVSRLTLAAKDGAPSALGFLAAVRDFYMIGKQS